MKLKNSIRLVSCVLAVLSWTSGAWALIEGRVRYGALVSSPDLKKLYTGAETLPSVAPSYGLGFEAIVSPPLVPIGVGLRYETTGLKLSQGSLEFATEFTRTALVVNYRIIDTLLFLGPIASYGISHSNSIKVKSGGTEISNFSSGSPSSYTVGLEGGTHLLGILVGAEVGYEYFMLKDAKDTGTAALPKTDIDLSGTYFTLMAGFSF